MPDDTIPPCQLCGAPVRLRRTRMSDAPLSATGPLYELVRVCTDRTCPSNQAERSLGDVP